VSGEEQLIPQVTPGPPEHLQFTVGFFFSFFFLFLPFPPMFLNLYFPKLDGNMIPDGDSLSVIAALHSCLAFLQCPSPLAFALV